jgi:hypothetical protein
MDPNRTEPDNNTSDKKPRSDWEAHFIAAALEPNDQEDDLVFEIETEFDKNEWTW